jgi:hypothetical protein
MARLQSFKPSVLIQGTRLRILTVSGGVVTQRPALGHGLGSFPMVYPAAQARYFYTHPDTRLYPSDSIADHAHNEYLQILIEMGLVGLGVTLSAFFLFLREGFQRLRRQNDSAVRMRRLCAFFGLLAILLHGLVDFPFHIVPIATVFLFCAALFFGPVTLLAGPPETVRSSEDRRRAKREGLRSARVARLTAILFVWALLIPVGWYQARRLRADALAKRGSNHLASQSFEESRNALGESLLLFSGQYQPWWNWPNVNTIWRWTVCVKPVGNDTATVLPRRTICCAREPICCKAQPTGCAPPVAWRGSSHSGRPRRLKIRNWGLVITT